MKEKRAVVVGAGLGGLTAAALLARNGFSVDLFEKNTTPGGYACSFVRGRFEFETSLHELSGLGPPQNRGSCYRLLEGCGVADKLTFLPIADFYSSVFPDFRVTIPHGWEQAEEAYAKQFPGERKGIKALLNWMRNIFKEFEFVASSEKITDFIQIPAKATNLLGSIGLTVEKALSREITDPKLKALFCDIWGYYGLPPSLLSFTLFAIANASYIQHGPHHIKGTSQALADAFVESIREAGGRVHLNNGVKKILIDDMKVRGVVTEQGDEYLADYVICNVNPVTTCLELIGTENVPGKYLDSLCKQRHSLSTFNIYMGMDCPATQLGLSGHELFINDGYDQDEHYRCTFKIGRQKYWVITNYNHADPEFSPPGTCVLVITAVVDGLPWMRIPPDKYFDEKNRMAREMLDAAEEVVVGLKEHIEVIEVSTPLTNIRYSSNPYGSIVGFDYSLLGSPVFKLSNRGPFKGLYFGSAWVRPGGGFEAAMSSGALAFREVLKDSKRSG